MPDPTRKLTCALYKFRLIAHLILFVALFIASATAKTKDANKPSEGRSAAHVLPNIGAFSPMLQHEPSSGVAGGHVLSGGAQKKSLPVNAADSQDPLFLPAVLYTTGGSEAIDIVVADVNADGKPDVLATDTYYADKITVFTGRGDGTFHRRGLYDSGGGSPVSMAVLDLNGDGKADLVVSNQTPCYACAGDGRIAVLLGNGTGAFQSPVTYSSGGSYAGWLAVADVNLDGKPDVVVTNCSPRGAPDLCGNGNANVFVSVLLGNGDGTLQPAVTYNTGGFSNNGLGGIAVVDVNGDSKPDVLVADGCVQSCPNGSVSILLGNGNGTFQAATHYSSGGWGAYGLAVADINGDGKLDVVVSNCGSNNCPGDGSIGVLLGNGNGQFYLAGTYASGGGLADSVAIADIDGDGKLDLAVGNVVSDTVGVLFGNGDGSFQPPLIFRSGTLSVTYTVALADVNGDEHPDLMVGHCARNPACGGTITGIVSVLLNNTIPHATTTLVTTSGSPSQVGQPVTFTATVTSKFGTIPEGELVTFSDGTTSLGSVPLAGGKAAFTTSSLSPKKHSISAAYVGDATFVSSSGTVTQIVEAYATTTALSSSPNPSQSGQAVTFTAHVTSTGPVPTGKVKFLDGTIGIGSATLSNGIAILTKSTLAVGTHPITAKYMGDSVSQKSSSAVVNQVVNP